MSSPLRPALILPVLMLCLVRMASGQSFWNIALEKIDDPTMAGSAVWADYNADGNMDLFLTGRAQTNSVSGDDLLLARLYRHIGIQPTLEGRIHRVFEQDIGVGVWMSDAAWGDFDGDGDLDLFVCGASSLEPPYAPVALLYRTEGETPGSVQQELDGVYGCAADWGDFDNDGDLDLIVSGAESPDSYVTQIYQNLDGTLVPFTTPLPAVAFGDLQWADADNDMDLDLAVTGVEPGGAFFSDVLLNDGGNFVRAFAPMQQVAFGSVDWGDYDNDADLDLLVTGASLSPYLVDARGAIFQNDGRGGFIDTGIQVAGIYGGNAKWGDLDNDGDLDVFQTGTQNFLTPDTGLFTNTGSTIRQTNNECPLPPLTCQPFEPLAMGHALVFDVDQDLDLDAMLIGLDANGERFLQIDRNDTINVPAPDSDLIALNAPPAAPDGLASTVSGNSVVLSWFRARDLPDSRDGFTEAEGLSYNLRVGTTSGSADVMPAMSTSDSGRRQLVRFGNTGSNLSWRLTLPPGEYFWSVQSVDHSFVGSPFSLEASFVIP